MSSVVGAGAGVGESDVGRAAGEDAVGADDEEALEVGEPVSEHAVRLIATPASATPHSANRLSLTSPPNSRLV